MCVCSQLTNSGTSVQYDCQSHTATVTLVMAWAGSPGVILYEWIIGGTSSGISDESSFMNVPPGNHAVILHCDDGPCTAITFTVPDVHVWVDSVTITDFTCSGNGSIEPVIVANHFGQGSGNVGTEYPYTVQWSGPDGYSSTAEEIGSLSPGIYTLTVTTSQYGCSQSFEYEVKDLSDFAMDIVTTPAHCTCDGTAIVGDVSANVTLDSVQWGGGTPLGGVAGSGGPDNCRYSLNIPDSVWENGASFSVLVIAGGTTAFSGSFTAPQELAIIMTTGGGFNNTGYPGYPGTGNTGIYPVVNGDGTIGTPNGSTGGSSSYYRPGSPGYSFWGNSSVLYQEIQITDDTGVVTTVSFTKNCSQSGLTCEVTISLTGQEIGIASHIVDGTPVLDGYTFTDPQSISDFFHELGFEPSGTNQYTKITGEDWSSMIAVYVGGKGSDLNLPLPISADNCKAPLVSCVTGLCAGQHWAIATTTDGCKKLFAYTIEQAGPEFPILYGDAPVDADCGCNAQKMNMSTLLKPRNDTFSLYT